MNGTAPDPMTSREFTAALSHALGRPTILPVAARPLRPILGAFAADPLSGGQRVSPAAASASGFCFRQPDIEAALGVITGRKAGGRVGPVVHAPMPQPEH